MRRDWIFPLCFFVALAVAFAPDAAFGTGVFWHHDFRHHHLPWREWAAAAWSRGEVPWWAPGASNGFPLLAEGQGGFLYPPTMLLFLWLPDTLALNWSVLGHMVGAAMGAWALARSERLRGWPALLAGVAYGFGGFIVSHSLYLGMENALAWLPWGLLGNRSRTWWLTALAIGMMGLAGHPQAAAFGGIVVVGDALWRREWRALAGVGVGSLIASPQIAASVELSRFSMRDGGVTDAFASIGALPVQELVGLVLPFAFGLDRPADIPQTYFHRGAGYWGAGVNHWEMCIYLGVVVAVCAVAGVRRAPGWLAVAIAAMALSVGGPLWVTIHHLPGFNWFRFPARWALVLSLASAMLAGHGLHAISGFRRPWVVRWRIHFVAAMFTLATGLAFLGLHRHEREVVAALTAHYDAHLSLPPPPGGLGPLAKAALAPAEPEDPAAIPGKVAHVLADLRESTAPTSPRVLWPLLSLLLVAAWLRHPPRIVILAAFELVLFGHSYHPRVPTSVALQTPRWLSPVMTAPGGPRTTVLDRRIDPALDSELLTANMGLPLGTNDVIIPSPLLLVRNEAFLAMAGLDVGDRGVGKINRYLDNIAIARRMGVRFVASVHEIPGLIPLLRGGSVKLFEDPGALPRARVVPCVEGVADVDAAFVAVRDANASTTVVVEGGTTGCAEPTSSLAAEVRRYEDQHVSITASGPGTLVLADTWYPGWVATVDGAPATIVRADCLFRGVTLPVGQHEVRFDYQPATLNMLLFVSASFLLMVVSAGAYAYSRPNQT